MRTRWLNLVMLLTMVLSAIPVTAQAAAPAAPSASTAEAPPIAQVVAQAPAPATQTEPQTAPEFQLTNPFVSEPSSPADTRGLAPAPVVSTNRPAGAVKQTLGRATLGNRKPAIEEPNFVDPVAQRSQRPNTMPPTIQNFEGVNNVDGVLPPDTNGQVGPNHYVQMVNLSTAIYDKQGNLLYGPFHPSDLWPSGDVCHTSNDGDPVVVYDQLADRWLLTQFALPHYPNGPFYECIAVSKGSTPTNDPNDWYPYTFQVHATKMDDYPKIGVWPDGYYMSANQFTSGWAGVGVWVFQRDKMLQGQPATFQYFDLANVDINYGGFLPSNLSGNTPPPAGTPNYYGSVDMNWSGTDDVFHIFAFHTDWNDPANSTFTLVKDLVTAPFDSSMCGGARSCIPQPGTSQGLDAIADRLMMHLWYRNFGDHDVLVTNHTVDVDGNDHAGIRWYEIRNPGPNAYIYQQGTYAPDSDNRWMGSVAMDGAGDIALGYSVSSSSVYPSIRYTGRLPSDPLGEMAQGEGTIIDGTGSQTHTAARWGDYSALSVDPVDDCTFWYTQEYIQTTGSAPWQTRIASFQFPNCVAAKGRLEGTVESDTGAPIQGATVTATSEHSYMTYSGSDGRYGFSAIPTGTYTVTAQAYGYYPKEISGVVVQEDMTTTQNISMTALPTYQVSGKVTDATTGWPLYAEIDIEGYPNSPIWTDPATGMYSVTLASATHYTFTVSAWVNGYTDVTQPVGPLTQNETKDFALNASLGECSAPGYHPESYVYTQDFEASDGGYTHAGAQDDWAWGSVSGWPYGCASGTKCWGTNLTGHYSDNSTAVLTSPVITLTDVPTGTVLSVSWQQAWHMEKGWDFAYAEVSINGGAWQSMWDSLITSEGDWQSKSYDISAAAGGSVQFRWRITSDTNTNYEGYYIDDVKISEGCTSSAGGLLVGNVYSGTIGGTAVNGVSVWDELGNKATSQATPNDDNVDDGFYTLFSPTGVHTYTAWAKGYGPAYANGVSIADGSTTEQDFALPAPKYYKVEGVVTDATTGWPLYASINVEGQTIWSDPVTGYYSITLAEMAEYNFNVSAWVDGYTDVTQHVGPLNGDLTQNFALSVDAVCTAPGYTRGDPLLSEDFEGAFPPSGWKKYQTGATDDPGWVQTNLQKHSGSFSAYHNDDMTTGDAIAWLVAPQFSVPAGGGALTFWQYDHWAAWGNYHGIWVSTGSGDPSDGDFVELSNLAIPADGSWEQVAIDLSAYAGQKVYVAFRYVGNYADEWYIDDVAFMDACAPLPGGLVVGNVYDANTGDALNDAIVSTTGYSATTAATTDSAVDDGFYTLFSPSGSYTITASMSDYADDAKFVNVQYHKTVRQDFSLGAGHITATPDGIHVTMPVGQNMKKWLTLANDGAKAATFELVEQAGGFIPNGPVSAMAMKQANGERRFVLAVDGKEDSVPAAPWSPSGDVNLVLDDGSAENSIGLTGGGQFLWLNRFTPDPSDFPFTLDEVWMIFQNSANVGEKMELVIWEDKDGDGDPGTNAVFRSAENVTVQSNDGTTWNVYHLSSPVFFSGPGDVLIGVVNRDNAGSHPAAIDQTASQHRSWIGLYSGNPPEPPTLPADGAWGVIDDLSASLAGNWMIRGSGVTGGVDVPWLSELPVTGTIAPSGTQQAMITFDGGVPETNQPGTYYASILVADDTPYRLASIPMTMTLTPPSTWGRVTGKVQSLGYCDVATPTLLADAPITITGQGGAVWYTSSDVSGTYQLWLDAVYSPLTITVSAPDHVTKVYTNVIVSESETTTQDLSLRWNKPCVSVDPTAYDVSLTLGMTKTLPFTITNGGPITTFYRLSEKNGNMVLMSPHTTQINASAPGNIVTIGDLGLSPNPHPATSASPSQPPYRPDGTYTLTESKSQTIQSGNSVACSAGGIHADNSYLRVFTLSDFGIDDEFTVINVEVGIETAAAGSGGSQPAKVRLYTLNGDLKWANMTLIGSADVTVEDQDLTIISVPVAGVVPAGGKLVVEFFTPDGSSDGNSLFVGSNNLGQTAPSYIAAADCHIDEPTDTKDIGFPDMHIVMNVTGSVPEHPIPWLTEVPTTGQVLGDKFAPITVTFDASDAMTQVTQPGKYHGTLFVHSADPNHAKIVVPVTMTVTPPADWGKVTGVISGFDHCDQSASPLPGTDLLLEAGNGMTWTVTTDVSGTYQLWMPAGPVTITVSKADYTKDAAVVTVPAGGTQTKNFTLRLLKPCVTVPQSYETTLELGDTGAVTHTITNSGAASTDWSMAEVNLGDEVSGPKGVNTLFSEDFEGSFPPAGWSVQNNLSGSNVWDRNDVFGAPNRTNGSGYSADADSDAMCGAPWDTELHSPPIDLSGTTAPELTYQSNFQDYAGAGEAWLYVSVDNGSTWITLTHWTADHGPTLETVDLSSYVGDTIILNWRYSDNGDGCAWYWQIDDVQISDVDQVTWLNASPASGSLPADTGAVDVVAQFDAGQVSQPGTYVAHLDTSSDDPNSPQTTVVTMTVTPPSGWHELTGTVSSKGRCDSDPWAIEDAQVHIQGDTVSVTLSTDENGAFSYWLAPGTYTFTVSADEHEGQSRTISVQTLVAPLPQVFLLNWLKPCLSDAPHVFSATLDMGTVMTYPLTITNSGHLAANFEMIEMSYGYQPALSGPRVINVPQSHRAKEGSGLMDVDWPFRYPLGGTYVDANPLAVQKAKVLLYHADDNAEPLHTILSGYPDIESVDVWDDYWDGTPTLGDLTPYDVVIVWNDYAYGDPEALGNVLADYVDAGGKVILTAFNWYDEDQLQGRLMKHYSPLLSTNEGNWMSEASLGTFDHNSRIMQGVTSVSDKYRDKVDLAPGAELIASWDDGEEFVAVKGSVVAINTYSGPYYQWTGDMGMLFHNAVDYLRGDIVPWLGETPEQGTVAIGGSATVSITMDATSLTEPGEYYAKLRVSSEDQAFAAETIPVTLTVKVPDTYGKLVGVVSGLGHCDVVTPTVLTGTEVLVTATSGESQTITTDDAGAYELWLAANAGPFTVTVAPNGYLAQTVSGVKITGTEVTTQNIALRPLEPCVGDVSPSSYAITLTMGMSGTLPYTVTNNGAGDLTWDLSEAAGGFQIAAPQAGEDVLVVSEDNNDAAALESALTALGYTYADVENTAFTSMDVSDLLGYKAVFYAGTPSSGSEDTQAVAYLDAGGRLLVTDHDYAFYYCDGGYGSPAQLGINYLKCHYVSDSGSTGVLTGTDIMAGINPDVSSDPYPDDITLLDSDPVGIFDAPSGNLAGLKIARNGYRAMLLTWDFHYAASVSDQTAIVQKAMDFFTASGGGTGGGDIPWLDESPSGGETAMDSTTPVALTFDAGQVDQPGVYTGTLTLKSNDQARPELPAVVAMTVQPPSDWGKLYGTINSQGYCDAESTPLEGATVLIASTTSTQTWELTTDVSGTYAYWLPPGFYTVTVAAADHISHSEQVQLGSGMLPYNFDLRWIKPCLTTTPTALQITLDRGVTATIPFTIANGGALSTSVTLVEKDRGREINGPQPLGSGPDTFGYVLRDSNDADGPAYNFVDISGSGTAVSLSDDSSAEVPLGFTFNFYGDNYQHVYINSNGFLSFGKGSVDLSGDLIPSTNEPNNIVALMWDDLKPGSGAAYYQFFDSCPYGNGACFVAEYQNFQHVDGSSAGTWEAILFRDGSILMQFADGGQSVGTLSTGIENKFGTDGLSYAYQVPGKPASQTAVCFAYPGNPTDCIATDIPWFDVSALNGYVDTDGAMELSASFDASVPETAQPGQYFGVLTIMSNDPRHPQLEVPLTLTVKQATGLGKLTGVVSAGERCDKNFAPLAGAVVGIVGQSGASWSATTDVSGTYELWLDAAAGPFTVTVSADGYASDAAGGVTVTADQITQQNARLRKMVPCISVNPTSFEVDLVAGSVTTRVLTISNSGAGALNVTKFQGADWLSSAQSAVTVQPDSSQDVVLTFDAHNRLGQYVWPLNIDSNDGQQKVSVTMNVVTTYQVYMPLVVRH